MKKKKNVWKALSLIRIVYVCETSHFWNSKTIMLWLIIRILPDELNGKLIIFDNHLSFMKRLRNSIFNRITFYLYCYDYLFLHFTSLWIIYTVHYLKSLYNFQLQMKCTIIIHMLFRDIFEFMCLKCKMGLD